MDLISLLRLQAAAQQQEEADRRKESASAQAPGEPAREAAGPAAEEPGAEASGGEAAPGLLGDDRGAGLDPLGDGGDVLPGQSG